MNSDSDSNFEEEDSKSPIGKIEKNQSSFTKDFNTFDFGLEGKHPKNEEDFNMGSELDDQDDCMPIGGKRGKANKQIYKQK
jgi:hypothetical protein